MRILRQFRKNLSLRLVNLAGLSIMLACLLLSAGFIKREQGYDRHHTNAERIVRLSLQFDDKPVDGRILGNALDDVLHQLPEVDRTVKIFKVSTSALTYQGSNLIVNDFYMVSSDFLHVFDLPLLQGNKDEALQRTDQLLISESLARKMFGEVSFDQIQASEILINGQSFSVSGIFRNIPITSHFHTDVLLHRPNDWESYTYTYLLLKDPTTIRALEQKITNLAEENELYQPSKPRALLMPLTDIHLHSHNLREMSINGSIHYIYLVTGANMLLLIVVLFNLWLNSNLIFSYNRRYYQLLCLNGATQSVAIKDETILALLWGILSIIVGLLAAYCVSSLGFISWQVVSIEAVALCLAFMLSVVAISLFPALKGISSILFLNIDNDLKINRFSYSNVKWMIAVQYAFVIVVVILTFGINKQMNLVKDMQVGGNERTILVMPYQPEPIRAKYDLLKTELLKHAEIESVTTAFQLPGDAVRDMARVKREDKMDWQQLPIMVAGEDFLPFFSISLVAGQGFTRNKYDYQTEAKLYSDYQQDQKRSEYVEQYVINRKALAILGFKTPDEAIGVILQIDGAVDYFQRGIIVGVADDFNYTGLYEETIPLLVMQRRMFQSCIMARLAPEYFTQARSIFEKVWSEVNPDYPANYVFMNDLFGKMYHNEMNAQQLVYIFSLLCFWMADLGLIVFMAFIIRRRTKEIAIRKVHGASVGDIVRMLNMNFIRYIALAFAIATPVAWYVMVRWLERFAYRVSLDWWLFALAGFIVLLISFVSVSLQSWRAAKANPAESIAKS